MEKDKLSCFTLLWRGSKAQIPNYTVENNVKNKRVTIFASRVVTDFKGRMLSQLKSRVTATDLKDSLELVNISDHKSVNCKKLTSELTEQVPFGV